ncbi:PDGLE domain-containing protein [Agromyces aureus]|uniref:PDGLE domain-containing protein n=1 Tax=Agromyces aureus TaxID=453304 RepID=UPI00137473DF
MASIWASSLPDGLTYVAEESGMAAAEQPSALAGSPLAGYGVFLVENPWLSVAIAGAVGCGVTFGLACVVGRVARRRRVAA